jgi:hypothetical protein
MDMKVTVSQAAHDNQALVRKILAVPLPLPAAAGEPDEQEPYNLVVLYRRQEASGAGAAAMPPTASAVLALFE